MPEPRFLIIGQVRRPHGVRGEVKVAVVSDEPERFARLKTVFISQDPDDAHPQPTAVEGTRMHGRDVLLKLHGVDSPEAAAALRNAWLWVPRAEALPLAPGEYYLYQLIGLAVYTDAGIHLGELREVLETGANNVFVVVDGAREILLPDIEQVIREINFDARTMTVTPLPGLL